MKTTREARTPMRHVLENESKYSGNQFLVIISTDLATMTFFQK
ncbi:hypothetical protein [Neobacillus cucumis]|nr:hypothetical protein [Neobacillus cucumis]MBM7653463.1 hypothetical protein [Neobacillus cucumis]